jgi:hypothetical protein
MERKVLFVEKEGVGFETSRLVNANHTEPLRAGLALVTDASIYRYSDRNYPLGRFVVTVHQFGQPIMEVISPEFEFMPSTAAKQYFLSPSVSVGGQTCRVGFSGKFGALRKRGWFPEFMHIKIEPA